jgi:hypothetical protein
MEEFLRRDGDAGIADARLRAQEKANSGARRRAELNRLKQGNRVFS